MCTASPTQAVVGAIALWLELLLLQASGLVSPFSAWDACVQGLGTLSGGTLSPRHEGAQGLGALSLSLWKCSHPL